MKVQIGEPKAEQIAADIKQRTDRPEMLFGQHLGRGHQGCLHAALRAGQHRGQRNNGFPRADIALEHASHRWRAVDVPEDVRKRALLRAGELERQRGDKACHCTGAVDQWRAALPLDPPLPPDDF